jgi:hypothetical protein
MSLKALAFKTFFGGKPWYKSVTGWAIVVLAAAETVVPLVGELGLADPAQMAVLTSYMVKLSAAMGALGIRRAVVPNGKAIAAVGLVALLALGCGTLTYTSTPTDGPPVTVKASYLSRGCVSLDVDPKTGKASIIHKQDGESNWAPWRVIPAMGAMVLVGLSGLPIIGDSITVPGPSDIGGCVGLFTNQPDTGEKPEGEAEKPAAVYLLSPIAAALEDVTDTE